MNFFTDTNIPIGYTVIHDKWHPQSKRFIIIVDAHDCGLTVDDLIFVSNDFLLIEAISNIDTSFLEIMEFRTCDN